MLIANGPLAEQTDERMRGMSIYVVPLADALELAKADPMVRAGRLAVKGARWWTASGRREIRDRLTQRSCGRISAPIRSSLEVSATPRTLKIRCWAPASPSSPKRWTMASVESASRSMLVSTVRSISS